MEALVGDAGVDAVKDQLLSGSCLCQEVTFTVKDADKNIWYCHCRQCRRVTGHYLAATRCEDNNLQIKGTVKWYYRKPNIRYGFCPKCGSQLFWKDDQSPLISILAGSFSNTSFFQEKGHIYLAEKGAYYDLCDNLPKYHRDKKG